MNILVKVDDDKPVIVTSASDLEVILLYNNWCELHLFDLDEMADKKLVEDKK